MPSPTGTVVTPSSGRGGSVPGGIMGVASKSTEKSLRQYNGRGAYNEWTFIAVQRSLQAGAGAEGAQTPGGVGGRGEPGAPGDEIRGAVGPEKAQRQQGARGGEK